MNVEELIIATRTMRTYQKAYFRRRDAANLALAKAWEKKVDELLEAANADKPKQGELL